MTGTMLNLRKPYTKTPFMLPAPSPIIILNKRRGDPWEATRRVFSIIWGCGVWGARSVALVPAIAGSPVPTLSSLFVCPPILPLARMRVRVRACPCACGACARVGVRVHERVRVRARARVRVRVRVPSGRAPACLGVRTRARARARMRMRVRACADCHDLTRNSSYPKKVPDPLF